MSKGFSIDDFKNKGYSTDICDQEDQTPYWIDSKKPKIIALYNGVLIEYERIKGIINSGVDITGKERKILNSKICAHAGVVKSYIRADREDTKHIIELIAEKNELLNLLWTKKRTLRNSSGLKPLKSEVEMKNKELILENEKLRDQDIKKYFQQWVDSFLVNDSKRMVAKIVDLEWHVDQLSEENIELRTEIGRLRKEYNRLMVAR